VVTRFDVDGEGEVHRRTLPRAECTDARAEVGQHHPRQVTKIEPTCGDPFRRFGRPTTPYSAVFANLNRSKRSLVLDLKSDDGRAQLLDLVRTSDVFLANRRAGGVDALGLSDDVLTATNPRLVRCFVTGFGPGGPSAAEDGG
jgi:formyl-CoA transferase